VVGTTLALRRSLYRSPERGSALHFTSSLAQATNFRLVQLAAQGATSAARYRRLQPVSTLPRPGICLSQCFGLILSPSCRFRPAYIRKPPLQGVTCASPGVQAPSIESTGPHSISSRWHRPRERLCVRSGKKMHKEDRSSTPRTGAPLAARARTRLSPTRSCHVLTICTRRPTIHSSTLGLVASVQDENRHSDVRNRLLPPPLPPARRQKYLGQAGHPSNITALSRTRKARKMQSTCARSWHYRQASRPRPVDSTRSRRVCMSGWCTRTSGVSPKATRDHPLMDGDACLSG